MAFKYEIDKRIYHQQYSQEHKDYYAERVREHRKRRRMILAWYKQSIGCMDCGEKDPDVLEFDHVEGRKLFNIGPGIIRYPLIVVWEEIQKCAVVCANCHRRRTATKRRNKRGY